MVHTSQYRHENKVTIIHLKTRNQNKLKQHNKPADRIEATVLVQMDRLRQAVVPEKRQEVVPGKKRQEVVPERNVMLTRTNIFL